MEIYCSKIVELGRNEKQIRACIFVVIFKKNFTLSHTAERKEKDCLNCGAILHGRYCHICGQENIIPRETFWGLVTHFFYDITHFDSKFFTTLKDLLFRPGFLPREFIKGRRVSYLHPVRMYMFTSAIFFLIFFSFKNPEESIKLNVDNVLTKTERKAAIAEIQAELVKNPNDQDLVSVLKLLNDSTRAVKQIDLIKVKENGFRVTKLDNNYRSLDEYDSVQKKLKPSARDNWIRHTLIKKGIEINNKFRNDPRGEAKKFLGGFLHKLPYLLFLSLPFFAAILKLLYIRRKQFYYADHGIFSIHHYIFSFIILLFVFAFGSVKEITGWSLMSFLVGLMFFIWPVYLYIAMRKFYRQGWFKTLVKFLLLNLLGFISLLLLFLFFFLISVFQL